MKIGYLGAGAWGFALARLLASKGYEVVSWTLFKDLVDTIIDTRSHPKLPESKTLPNQHFTTDLNEAVNGADMIVESVTSAGIRPVFEQLRKLNFPKCPIVITSKGIEQNTGLILSDVVREILGEEYRPLIGAISGPSYATEVVFGQPTSVTGTAYDPKTLEIICQTFNTDSFRVYPNEDVRGASLGGALKNIIAIACGVAEGLNLGYSARAALMTRGLHEIRKLAVAMGAKSETLTGLSGMGDLCVTCSAMNSRNFRFGYLLSQGKSVEDAKNEIGMVVEGAYTCVSALQLSQKLHVEMPITECVHRILFENLSPQEAVRLLMQRKIKPEHI